MLHPSIPTTVSLPNFAKQSIQTAATGNARRKNNRICRDKKKIAELARHKISRHQVVPGQSSKCSRCQLILNENFCSSSAACEGTLQDGPSDGRGRGGTAAAAHIFPRSRWPIHPCPVRRKSACGRHSRVCAHLSRPTEG
jgi:hypothetical protein